MPFVEWFVHKFVHRPRLWTEKEWIKFSYKEKLWVWYKHHYMLYGQGSAELNQLTNPFAQLFVFGSLALLLWEKITTDFRLGITPEAFYPYLVLGSVGIVLFALNLIVQWKIGNWKDRKDLIALESEIGNRRNRVFREIRTERKKQPHKFP